MYHIIYIFGVDGRHPRARNATIISYTTRTSVDATLLAKTYENIIIFF